MILPGCEAVIERATPSSAQQLYTIIAMQPASRVSPSFREAHTDTPWSEIVGMRHQIVHDFRFP